MDKNKITLSIVAAVILTVILLFSCNGGGNGTAPGTVALYIADDMSLFSQVTATINQVQLVNTGIGSTCDILSAPIAVNIANLSDVMQLVSVAGCIPGSYNRFRIQFDKNVQLVSGATGTNSPCSFTSFKDQNQGNQPNILHCDSATDICSLDVNGAVNVLAAENNKHVLDFDLKEFDISDFGSTACAVTMKVSPMTPQSLRQQGFREAVTGLVSRLSVTDRTFDLTRGNRTFRVIYAGITETDQPGLDELLQRAQDDGLRAKVISSEIDFVNNTIDAAEIAVKVEGTVSSLVTNDSFSVSYGQGGAKTIEVDYSAAVLSGILVNGAWVDVKLFGRNQISNMFLANKVEVETQGMITED